MSSVTEQVATNYFDGFKLGTVQKRFLWIAAFAYAFDQIDAMLFAFVSPLLMQQWGLTTQDIGTMNSLLFLGMTLGGLVSGWFSDKFGRKPALITFIAIFSIANLLTFPCQPYHFALLELTRFFTGFGCIGMTVVAMVYISEMMPSEHRGRYQSICVSCGTLGVPLGAMFANWAVHLGGESWRLLFLFGGAGIILVPISIFILKESPRWLVSKGRVQEAETIVTLCLHGIRADLSLQAERCVKSTVGYVQTCKIMFGKKYIKRTLSVGLAVMGVMIGNYFLGNWYPTMLVGFGLPIASILMVQSISAWGTPFGDFLSAWVTDKGGRKIPIACCGLALAAIFLFMGFFKTSLVVYCICSFGKAILGAMAATMNWSYLAESYPVHIRNSASGLIFSICRFGLVFLTATVPILLVSIGYLGLHIINALFFAIPAIIVLVFGEKTSDKTLEELEIC